MSDVEIVFPKGRETAVRRLHDALAETGYDVGSREVDEGDRAPAAGGANALLILWDRSTMAHPGLEAIASAARHRDRAIDVSVDGITPLGLQDDRSLIHLSGWRGDPHHPGWRKILARLDELNARRTALSARPAPAPSRAEARAPTAAAAGAGRTTRPRVGRAALAAAGAVLLLVVVVAGLLSFGNRSAPSRPQAAVSAGAPPAPAAASPVASTAAPTVQPQAAPAASQTSAVAEPVSSSPAQSIGAAALQPQPAARATPIPHRTHVARPRTARRPAIRYTRYSGTMRLFCQRAGRNTPQCRVFNAAMGR